jgi:hypothetical protein
MARPEILGRVYGAHHVCSTATERRCLPRLAAWVGGAFTTRGGSVRVAGLLDPSGPAGRYVGA